MDTGSPVSIISLDFLLEALAKQRAECQSLKQWEESVPARLQNPGMVLKSYGGEELPIIRQITCWNSRGDYAVEATLQVQKEAPVRLLIGTDLQAQLGFLFLQMDSEQADSAKDLLQEKAWVSNVPLVEIGPAESPPLPAPVVHLIQAARLPVRHVKLVRARVDMERQDTSTLFEPAENLLEKRGLVMDSSPTKPDTDQCVILVIHNPSCEPVRLKKGQVLGKLQEAKVLPVGSEERDSHTVRAVDANEVGTGEESTVPDAVIPLVDRTPKILDALQLSQTHLDAPEKAQLERLITKYADAFALDHSELGSTDIVTYSVDTGDHPTVH